MDNEAIDNSRNVFSRLVARLSLCTRLFVFVNIFCYSFNVMLRLFSFQTLCLLPRLITRDPIQESYRIITSSFTHASFVHLILNVFAFVQVGISLEQKFGSVMFMILIMTFTALCGVTHVIVANVVNELGFMGAMNECAVGFSGVIFALIVVDTQYSRINQRDVFGLFSVNAFVYPFALIAVVQFLAPQSSIVGHLSGVIVGILYTKGWLNFVIVGSGTVERLETTILRSHLDRLIARGLITNTGQVAHRQRSSSASSWFDIESQTISPGGTTRRNVQKWWEIPVVARMQSGESQLIQAPSTGGRRLGGGDALSTPPQKQKKRNNNDDDDDDDEEYTPDGLLKRKPSPPPSSASSTGGGRERGGKSFPYSRKFLDLLVEMGFNAEESMKALELCDNDVARAIDELQKPEMSKKNIIPEYF